MRKNKKGTGRIPLAAWLGYLLAVTFLVTGVTFSSYITTTSGGDTARVARWSIEQGGLNSTLAVRLAPKESQGFPLTLSHNSEVAVEYVVTVENLTDNLPLEFSLAGPPGVPVTAMTQSGALWTGSAQLPPTASVQNYNFTLTVAWDSEETSPARVGQLDLISVQAQALQKD